MMATDDKSNVQQEKRPIVTSKAARLFALAARLLRPTRRSKRDLQPLHARTTIKTEPRQRPGFRTSW